MAALHCLQSATLHMGSKNLTGTWYRTSAAWWGMQRRASNYYPHYIRLLVGCHADFQGLLAWVSGDHRLQDSHGAQH